MNSPPARASHGQTDFSNQLAQDLRSLPAQLGRLDIERAGALFLALALGQHRAAVPAGAHRDRGRPGADALPVAREVDDRARLSCDFVNHCALAACGRVIADNFRSMVQPTVQILAEAIWRVEPAGILAC